MHQLGCLRYRQYIGADMTLWADQDEKDEQLDVKWSGDTCVSVSNIVLEAEVLCFWVGFYLYKPSVCRSRSDRGLTAEWQRTVSDVAESGRLQSLVVPEDNLATSTIDVFRAETLKAYFRDMKTRCYV